MDEHHILPVVRSWVAGDSKPWPLAQIHREWNGFENYRLRWSRGTFNIPDYSSVFKVRKHFIREFGFVIPCQELMNALREIGPIVEIGAGSGYMTKLMRNEGIEVIGSDPQIEGYGFDVGRYDPHQVKAQAKTIIRRVNQRRQRKPSIFCSWPSYDQTWFQQALKAMVVGQKIAVVREDATGNEGAWNYMDDRFSKIRSVEIPTWEGMHDRLEIWIKVKP